MEYAMLIELESNGRYSGTFPDLPGCFTDGATVGEIIFNAEDAIETHLSGLRELGRPIPRPRHKVATVGARVPEKKVG